MAMKREISSNVRQLVFRSSPRLILLLSLASFLVETPKVDKPMNVASRQKKAVVNEQQLLQLLLITLNDSHFDNWGTEGLKQYDA